MRPRFTLLLAVFLTASIGPGYAQPPVHYQSRTAFETVAPGLAMETFETALAPDGTSIACMGPLVHDAEDPACFPHGSIAAGPIYNGYSGWQPALRVIGPGWNGAISKSVVINNFFDGFVVDFPPPGVESAGFDIVDSMGGYSGCNLYVAYTNGVHETFNNNCDAGGSNFVGIVSTFLPITRIEISDLSFFLAGLTGMDNLEFGTLTSLEAHSVLLDPSGVNGQMSATLSKKSDGSPIAGQRIDFTVGDTTCSGVTDASGTASCGGPGEAAALVLSGRDYEARFRGSYPYAASSSSAGLIVIHVP